MKKKLHKLFIIKKKPDIDHVHGLQSDQLISLKGKYMSIYYFSLDEFALKHKLA